MITTIQITVIVIVIVLAITIIIRVVIVATRRADSLLRVQHHAMQDRVTSSVMFIRTDL